MKRKKRPAEDPFKKLTVTIVTTVTITVAALHAKIALFQQLISCHMGKHIIILSYYHIIIFITLS